MKKGTPLSRKCLISFEFGGVADGTRTHDNWNHNPGLYQLSYSHHWGLALMTKPNRQDSIQFRTVYASNKTNNPPGIAPIG